MIGGGNSAERLANTRGLMQGLARQELEAAKGMKGQGQITESERAILRKAEAGQIDDFTPAEFNAYLNAIEKTAFYRIRSHDETMKRVKTQPGVGNISQFYELPPVAEPQQGPPAPSAPAALRYDRNGKRLP